MKALLVRPDWSNLFVTPKNGTDFSLEELRDLLDCELPETIRLFFNTIMVIDDNGKNRGKKLNELATQVYRSVIPSKEEREKRDKELEDLGFKILQLGDPNDDTIVGNALFCHISQIR